MARPVEGVCADSGTVKRTAAPPSDVRGLDRPALRLDQLPDVAEAEPHAAELAGVGVTGLEERREQGPQRQAVPRQDEAGRAEQERQPGDEVQDRYAEVVAAGDVVTVRPQNARNDLLEGQNRPE